MYSIQYSHFAIWNSKQKKYHLDFLNFFFLITFENFWAPKRWKIQGDIQSPVAQGMSEEPEHSAEEEVG